MVGLLLSQRQVAVYREGDQYHRAAIHGVSWRRLVARGVHPQRPKDRFHHEEQPDFRARKVLGATGDHHKGDWHLEQALCAKQCPVTRLVDSEWPRPKCHSERDTDEGRD